MTANHYHEDAPGAICPLCEGMLLAEKNDPIVARIDLWYPRTEGSVAAIQVGLMDVRAADDIRIRYDFDRDGWVIQQASVFQFDADDMEMDMGWQESAFIPAWGKKRDRDDR